jgi:chemotaxis protein methyltransferase CheR
METICIAEGRDFAEFCQGIQRLWNVNLSAYNPGQLQRRLRGIMSRVGVPTLAEFLRYLEGHPQQSAEFQDRFMINVTQFFRDERHFGRLEEILKAGGFHRQVHRIWSAACSVGMEPYSVAMIMDELSPQGTWKIEATDLDTKALAAAREGLYKAADLEDVPLPRRTRYFHAREEEPCAVVEALMSRVRFSALDLLDPRGRQPRNCDLVLCRNVTIYFGAEAKDQVYRLLAGSLRPGGILFIGATERISPSESTHFRSIQPFFYERTEAA